jgi:Ca2+-binding EF-hand superfamily protein
MEEIKNVLKSRGAMAIRGIGRVFRILDDNRNRQVDLNELMWGLKDFGIHLQEGEAKAVLAKFDRDGSGAVNFDEFIRTLRGDLSERRVAVIKLAYNKLDVNQDGQVSLDDVAKLYDVSMHPDVIAKHKTPEQAYKEFMSLWDTQVADGIVTFDEFCDYMRDVSCSVDTDDYFEAMMKSAWKL